MGGETKKGEDSLEKRKEEEEKGNAGEHRVHRDANGYDYISPADDAEFLIYQMMEMNRQCVVGINTPLGAPVHSLHLPIAGDGVAIPSGTRLEGNSQKGREQPLLLSMKWLYSTIMSHAERNLMTTCFSKKVRKVCVNELGQRNYLLTVDGDIGAGKTTFCLQLQRELEKRGMKTVLVEEPLPLWEVHGYPKKFYENMKEESYKFQTLACPTRLQQLTKALEENGDAVCIIMDRSMEADSLFVDTLHKGGFMNDDERALYFSWWDKWKTCFELYGLTRIPLFINTSPSECMIRKEHRGREYEKNIDIGYLQMLFDMHVEALPKRINEKLLEVDGSIDFQDERLMEQLVVRFAREHVKDLPEEIVALFCATYREEEGNRDAERESESLLAAPLSDPDFLDDSPREWVSNKEVECESV